MDTLESALTRVNDVINSLRASEPTDDEQMTGVIINDAITTLGAAAREIENARRTATPDPVATQPMPPAAAPAPDHRTYMDFRFRYDGTPAQAQEFIDRIRFANSIGESVTLVANPGQMQSANVVDPRPTSTCQAWRIFRLPASDPLDLVGWRNLTVGCTRSTGHTALHGATVNGNLFTWGD
jgi:hypothetical protein